jgi:hypothetical protein
MKCRRRILCCRDAEASCSNKGTVAGKQVKNIRAKLIRRGERFNLK